LALGGSDGVGDGLRATSASSADHVQGGEIGPDCGHFLPEECPDELTEAIVTMWQSTPRANWTLESADLGQLVTSNSTCRAKAPSYWRRRSRRRGGRQKIFADIRQITLEASVAEPPLGRLGYRLDSPKWTRGEADRTNAARTP
jgi:hypothetical protein